MTRNLNPRQFKGAELPNPNGFPRVKGVNIHGLSHFPNITDAERLVHGVLSQHDPDLVNGMSVHVGAYDMQPGHAGEYEHATNTARIHPDVIGHEQGLNHEIGHRLSSVMGNASAQYDTPERRASEEYFATRYAERHPPPPKDWPGRDHPLQGAS